MGVDQRNISALCAIGRLKGVCQLEGEVLCLSARKSRARGGIYICRSRRGVSSNRAGVLRVKEMGEDRSVNDRDVGEGRPVDLGSHRVESVWVRG